ncbi:MAG: hypothetical protein K9H25_02970 [Rhodospirillum sp.]|nr:hypothetical protein [Rhodospirillum sp.]MCF8488617.1 hypothetical protein [Rhodospirillum sp.]MCF8502368.1 hypothetical protein [Rhodospirillum sp.]
MRGYAIATGLVSALFVTGSALAGTLTHKLDNPVAYIPSQCYTKTVDAKGEVHNPCFTCHQSSTPPNYVNDRDLQLSYDFAGPAETNHWSNLFEDRRKRNAAIPDAAIDAWAATDNYHDADGSPILAKTLAQVPAAWDENGDGQWGGYVPDAFLHFDDAGFDIGPKGEETGWRVFAYYPFPGTFWPTNGSTDDVMIRLSDVLRRDASGALDRETYALNLAIVEAVARQTDVALAAPVDETRWGVDLDKDGGLGEARHIAFDWDPLAEKTMTYVGAGQAALAEGSLHLAGGLYPEGTEFLHSVRYITVDADGTTGMAPRMKELRYMVKTKWQTYSDLQTGILAEAKEKSDFPDRLRDLFGDAERGIPNGQGWVLSAFIEDGAGALRPQTYEETAFCTACHGGLGATTDSVFSYTRRLPADSWRGGWYHWAEKGLTGVPEPKRTDGQFEYTYYLEQNHAADEFRANTEAMERFLNADGTLKADRIEALHGDISLLLMPSAERARALNKAYRVIVEDQDFEKGRDATLAPLGETVHDHVATETETGIEEPVHGPEW